MAKMTEHELRTVVSGEIKSSVGYLGSEITSARADNIERYLGEPYGNEQEGRSQVITTDVMDTVEWIMPELMRIFEGSDDVCEFEPEGPEDVEGARQATDYVNFVYSHDNEGFLNSYQAIKDGLIEKCGVLKVWWEETEAWRREAYEGLDDVGYEMILSDPVVEVVEHSEYPGEMAVMHDVVVKRKESKGRVRIEPVPSDEFLISRDGKRIQDARFVGHKKLVTESELLEEGYDRKTVERLGSSSSVYEGEEDLARDSLDHEFPGDDANNKAMREITKIEAYVRVDYDGDGIAELRRIVVAGESHEVLENEPWDGMRPFAAWSPIIMPHRFFGLCPVDLVKDIQLIRTTILRQYLDGLYLANVPQYECDVDRLVDETGQEVMDRRPGTIIRKRGAEPVLTPTVTAFQGEAALRGMEYMDQLRENRTGVSQRTTGLSADTLHDTKGGQELLFTAAKSRIELMARVCAETLFKDTFKLILELSQRYQDKARMVRLRNQWVPMDPRAWREGMDMTVNVGLGNGSRDQQAAMISQILNIQTQGIQMQGGANGPLFTLDNVYNAVKRFVESAGFKDTDSFVTEPSGPMQQQGQEGPPPEVVKAQMDAQAKLQAKQMELDAEFEIKTRQQDMEFMLKQREMHIEAGLAQGRDLADLAAEFTRIRGDLAVKRQQQAANVGNVQFGGEMG